MCIQAPSSSDMDSLSSNQWEQPHGCIILPDENPIQFFCHSAQRLWRGQVGRRFDESFSSISPPSFPNDGERTADDLWCHRPGSFLWISTGRAAHWCSLGPFPSLRLSQSHSLFPSLGLAVQNASFVVWEVAWWAAQSLAACLCDGLQKRHVEPITHLHPVTGLSSWDPCMVRNRDQ